ncbi:hypothetical protein ACULPM_10855 [Thermophilibacter sp. ZX-H3]|uniref:hypothetical protein n=1 Tax=unclassified Thermophilibacter TaxID=2847308 RepID=UPI0040407B01
MRSKLVSGVLTAALAMSLVPAPALADALESVGQQPEEQVTAEEPAAPAEEIPVEKNEASVAKQELPADSEKDAAEGGEAGSNAQVPEAVADAQDSGIDDLKKDSGQGALQSVAAPTLSSVTAFTPQMAQQSEAPKFDLDKVVGTVLSYQIDAGSLRPARHGLRASEIPDGMIESVSEPVQNESGGWDITVTLKAGTAADYNIPEGYLRGYDADHMVMDPSAETRLQFVASTSDATATTWQVFASDRAQCTFVYQEPEQTPSAPTKQDVASIEGAMNYTLLNEDGSEAYSARVSIPAGAIESVGEVYEKNGGCCVDVTVASENVLADYGIEPPAFYGSDYALKADASDLTMTLAYADGVWNYTYPDVVSLTFYKPEPTVAFDIDDVLDADNAVHYYASGSSKHATAITSADNVVSVGEPVFHASSRKNYWTVEVTLKTEGVTAADYGVPTGYLGGTDPEEWVVDQDADNKVTTSFTLREGNSRWDETTSGYALLHFVHEQAPEFALADVVDDRNTVSYSLRRAAGGAYESRASIGSVENVEKVGEPYRNADGDWAVDVTLKSDVQPSDFGIEDWQTQGKPYALDADASKLTVTFVWTTSVLGDSSWQSNGISNNGSVVFVEQTAPAFDVADELNTYGTVTYDLIHADGTSSRDNGTTIRQSANVEKVGEAYLDADGNWAVDVTLSGNATPDDYNVPNWQMHDDEYELDADASKLTVTFRTNGVDGTTWYCSGADRANLVFVGKAAEPSVAFDLDAALAAYHTVHYMATTQTIENSTSIGKTENVESVSAPVYDEAADRWTVEVTLKSDGVTAADYGVLAGFLNGSDPAGWVIDPNAENDLTVTFALESGSNAWTMADGGYALLHFVEKAAPAAPAFDIVDELDVAGTVSYEVRNADGSTYDDGGFGAILSEDNVEKIGEVRQEADGTWSVEVTLASDLTPADLGVDDWKLGEGAYSIDPSSKLTLTFRTLSADGVEWYVLGEENRANVVFVERAGEQNPGGEVTDPSTPSDPSDPDDSQKGDDKPGEDGTNDNPAQPATEKDASGEKRSRGSKDGMPETGDATSVAFAGVAVTGVVALAAGIALERKRSVD